MITEVNLDKLILWALFCMVLGLYDAVFYSRIFNGRSKFHDYQFDLDPHYVSVVLRFVVMLMLVIRQDNSIEEYNVFGLDWLVVSGSVVKAIQELFGLALMFSFFHNGAYYTARGSFLDRVPGYWWFGSSDTTTAKVSFGGIFRTLMFVVGFIIYTDIFWY